MMHQWESWADCTFCNGFISMTKGDKKAFFEPFPILAEKPKLYFDETENFILIPDIAPLSEDHMLLISKPHVPSFAAISEAYLGELEFTLRRTLARMEKFHPTAEIFIFEHGVGYIDERVIKCGTCNRTDHAHIHILPLPRTRDEGIANILAEHILNDHPLRLRITNSIPALSLRKDIGRYPYILLWSSMDISKTYLLIQDSLNYTIPSQVVRKLLALYAFGLHEKDADRWDWRNLMDLYPQEMENTIRNTIQRWGMIQKE